MMAASALYADDGIILYADDANIRVK